MKTLLETFDLSGRLLQNRFVMAPMTRARRPDCVADEETATYYSQRASAGLIVSEGTFVSPEAQGYIQVPGIWTAEQVAGWKLVTDAVHDADGTMFAQLWHVGRISHTSLQPGGQAPVSSSSERVDDPRFKVFCYREDAFELISGYAGHLLVISAEEDRVIPSEIPRKYVAAGRNCITVKHHVVARSSHNLNEHYEREPQSRQAAYAAIASLCQSRDSLISVGVNKWRHIRA